LNRTLNFTGRDGDGGVESAPVEGEIVGRGVAVGDRGGTEMTTETDRLRGGCDGGGWSVDLGGKDGEMGVMRVLGDVSLSRGVAGSGGTGDWVGETGEGRKGDVD
jgi:hypothetical protein